MDDGRPSISRQELHMKWRLLGDFISSMGEIARSPSFLEIDPVHWSGACDNLIREISLLKQKTLKCIAEHKD
jgi:hypothetical protein